MSLSSIFYFIAINPNSMWKPRCALLRVTSIVITSPATFPVAEWFSKHKQKGQASFPWNFILKWASWVHRGTKAMESGFPQSTYGYLLEAFHFFLLCNTFALPLQQESLQADHYVEFYHHGRNFRNLVKASLNAWLNYENQITGWMLWQCKDCLHD